MKHFKLVLLALFTLASCNSTIPATDHRVFDIAISEDFGVGGYEYKANTGGIFVSTTASNEQSYSSLGSTLMITHEIGGYAGLTIGQENMVGYEAGGHYFMEKGFVLGVRYNQLAEAVLFSIGRSF